MKENLFVPGYNDLEAVEIKNTNIGLTLLSLSAIIYGSSLIAASNYSQVVRDGGEWNSRYGIFGTALREVGTLPLIISVILAIAGVILIVLSVRKH